MGVKRFKKPVFFVIILSMIKTNVLMSEKLNNLHRSFLENTKFK